jgi:hypothetical protein
MKKYFVFVLVVVGLMSCKMTRKPEAASVVVDASAQAVAALPQLNMQGVPVNHATPQVQLVSSEPAVINENGVTPLSGLLMMGFEQAKLMSQQHGEFGQFKVAGDFVEVSPQKLTARGKVYVSQEGESAAQMLAQEAWITKNEMILRGKPIVVRGNTVIEGLASSTMFYFYFNKLRVLGAHKVKQLQEFQESDVTSMDWLQGSLNPLLPPLESESISAEIRQKMIREAEAEAVLIQSRLQPVVPVEKPVDIQAKTEIKKEVKKEVEVTKPQKKGSKKKS